MRPLLLAALLALVGCGRTQVVRYPRTVDAGVADGGADAGDLPCMPGLSHPRRAVPTVMFVLDRSGSMNFDLAGHTGDIMSPLTGPTRWATLQTSLSGVLPRYDDALSMGVVLFPANDFDFDGCNVSSVATLAPARNNSAAVLQLFSTDPSGGTPTFDAVRAASDGVSTINGAVLVLVTDGEPNCNVSLDPVTCICTNPTMDVPPQCFADSCLDDTRSINAIREVSNTQRLATYVIGVGADGSNANLARTLDAMAIAGGVPRVGATHSFYSATSPSELTTALDEITARISKCTFLTGTLLEPGDSVEVQLGGAVVPYGAAGWEWTDQTAGRFTLAGQYCDRAVGGEAVTLVLACH
jgi:hypothetical protein